MRIQSYVRFSGDGSCLLAVFGVSKWLQNCLCMGDKYDASRSIGRQTPPSIFLRPALNMMLVYIPFIALSFTATSRAETHAITFTNK